VSTFGNLAGTNKWVGGVLAPNGCIYGIPFASTTILKIDTSDDSVSTFGNLPGGAKWYGGVLAPNGCIYGIPYNSASVLKIDTSDDSVSTFGNLPGGAKWFSGVLAPNGCIYGIPYNSASVLKIDTSDDSVSTFGNLAGTNKWTGGVLAPNGCIYGIPLASTTILKIDTSDGATVTSLRKIINKQAGDFEYTECSQHVEYDSGLHTLILRLRDKKLDTLIFNDWGSPNDLPKTPYYAPLGGTLEYRTWYVHNDFTNLSSGEDQNDIKTWIHYTASETFVKGLCYNFAIYFNRNVTNDTIFTISYSQSTNRSMAGILRVGMFFFLRIDSGSYNNYLVKLSPPLHSSIPYHDGREDLTCINLIGPNSVFYNNNAYNDQVFVISESEQKEKTWTLSKEFNLTRMPVRIYNSGTTYINYNHGLKALLGDVEFQKFNITFCSPVFSLQKTNYSVYQYGHMFPDVYLGDINASVNVEEIDNEITYTLNENFIKTKEVDLYLFDLKNMNYGNALLEADGFTRTNLWSSEKSPTPIPLYEIFAKSLFRKYGRTIHRLKGTIKYDGILKPFTIIEDDTVLKNDSNPISFLLNKFTWDLNQGTYDITADEYSDEDVTVDGVMYDSEGDPEWYGQLPDTPENLRAMMRGFLYHPIKVMWDAVPRGVTGYVLLRRPYYASGGVLVDEPKIIYVGKNTECIDFLTDIATYSDGMDIHYKVASYRGDFSLGSLYSNEITVNWHK
jgi:hypothetical protein